MGLLACARITIADRVPNVDVDRVFASWDEWHSTWSELVGAIDDFNALTEDPISDAERLLEVMEARDRVYRVARTVEGHIYLRLQLDGGDEEALARQRFIDETDSAWSSTGLPWFTHTVRDLGRQRVEQWMASNDRLRRYDFFFRRFFEWSERRDREEPIAAARLSELSRRQSARIYQALAVAEAPAVEVTLESGERLGLGPQNARTVLEQLRSPSDRRAVNRAWLGALARQSGTYAALLEGIVERQKALAELRGYDSALNAHLHGDAIPADAVRTVIQTARRGSAPLREYHALRRKVLGIDTYGMSDRFVPLLAGGPEISFDETRALLVEAASILGPEVQGLVDRAFADGWIDAVERPGKRAHGGATFVAGEPFVLVNYRGTLEVLFKLIHEIGHAVHALLAHQAQPFVYSHPSSLTGETIASVFEAALVESMVRRAESPEDRIRVLDLSIQNILRLFYRPMLDADFELRLYESDIPVTGPSLAELYRQVVGDFYGDTVELAAWDAHAWQRTPHYYTSPLYMGRYGLSSAAAGILASRLTSESDSEREEARRDLLALMRSGSSGYPIELLREAGVDLEDPTLVDRLVARFDLLVGAIGTAVDER